MLSKAIFKKLSLIIFSFFLAVTLHADWNQTFDEQSNLLMKELPAFQNPTYLQQYKFFIKARKLLLEDVDVTRKIQKVDLGKKRMLFKKKNNLIIKKRCNNHIHELYTWELSYLLGSQEFIVPAFPVEIGGKKVVVQKIEPFTFGSYPAQEILEKVSLETYWKAHIQAYLLGFCDLAGNNIGVNAEGKIRFFDNEACLGYYNHPIKAGLSFATGFVSHSFNWPQYRTPLDKQTAKILNDFVHSFAHVEEQLKVYGLHRSLPFSTGINFCLEKVRNFPIKEGATFRDFYGSIYPQMSAGLDELNQIVGQILGRNVDHGTALFIICRKLKHYTLSPEIKFALDQWIEKYIESTNDR